MINRRLTTVEAARRLGVKPATVYAYVSRGLLHPERGPAGSTFDRHEVAELARTARQPAGAPAGPRRRTPARPGARTGDGPEAGPGGTEAGGTGGGAGLEMPEGRDVALVGDPLFLTELTLISDGRLFYRGLDAAVLSRTWGFERTAQWLWSGDDRQTGRWPPYDDRDHRLGRALDALGPEVPPVERFAVATVTASLQDVLRHDLDPRRVPVTGRSLLMALAASLPLATAAEAGDGAGGRAGGRTSGRPASVAELVWRGLTGTDPEPEEVAATDAALVLAADHELAPSTLAARVAASFRADPYAVVQSGLGPASGSWPAGTTGAPGEVESLLVRAASLGAERAIGEHLRRSGQAPHGFGMPLYPGGDPRGGELLERIAPIGPAPRREVVEAVIGVGRRRGFPPPNFDMALGALSFCAGMVPGAGQAVFTLGKVAGWLAHAMEEYAEPTRFRIRADYAGVAPEVGVASEGVSGS